MLSIIVPAYNEEENIKKCLNSIISQMSSTDELIIVDDGSTDATFNEVSKILKEYPHVKIHYEYQKNSGLGSACNKGIDLSSNDYIQFVDGDDFLENRTLVEIKKILTLDIDILIYDIENIISTNESKITGQDLPKETVFGSSSLPKLILSSPSAKNKVFKRSLFVNSSIRFPQNLWFEDFMTTTKLYSNAKTFYYTPKIRYQYVHQLGSIIRSDEVSKNSDILVVIQDIMTYYQSNFPEYINDYSDDFHKMIVKHLLIHPTTRIIKNSKVFSKNEKGLISSNYKFYNQLLKKYNFKRINFSNNKYFTVKEKFILFSVMSNNYLVLRYLYGRK